VFQLAIKTRAGKLRSRAAIQTVKVDEMNFVTVTFS
jgi:hypothetical protein